MDVIFAYTQGFIVQFALHTSLSTFFRPLLSAVPRLLVVLCVSRIVFQFFTADNATAVRAFFVEL